MKTITSATLLAGSLLFSGLLGAAPLKVYLMAGQSNMQGFCSVTTFPQIAADPKTAPILKKIMNPDGTPQVHENVWISTSGCAKDAQPGQLTTGFGGGKGDRIGPELTFGIYMEEHVKEPILLIKTAWGGKSLCRDFRPPSAGIHPTHLKALEELRKANKDTAELDKEYAENHGKYYRMMIAHAQSVLGDINKVYPGYDASQGYQLAGFVWFQGENDFGQQDTYPNAGQPGGFDEYTRLLACLIRDVRKDFKAPGMNAVIGVLGFNGELETERYRQIEPKHIPWLREFRKAMAAPAEMPEFKGHVAAVRTEEFWEPRLEELQGRWKQVKAKSGELKAQGLNKEQQKAAMDEFLKTVYNPEEWKLMETGVSHACYHYLGSAKIMARIGKAFAEAMTRLEATHGASSGAPPSQPADGKLKIFILSGQSNMIGFGQVKGSPGTMETYLKSNPKDYGHLVDGKGEPVVRNDVWVVDLSYPDKQRQGWLTTGFGADAGHIGPEYGFGFKVGDYYADPVLIIKSAWGGRSLSLNFLPPSAGDYPKPQKDGDAGFQYAEILRHVEEITGNLKKYFPDYSGKGWEIVGFGWHQGWNDRIDQKAVDAYENNLVHLIKDLRKDLKLPQLPFVIANTGMGGWNIPERAPYKKKVEKLMDVQLAVADPAKYPDFKGNVSGVETRGFQRSPEESPSKQEFHWMRNWETYYLIGNSMGDSMVGLLSGKPIAPAGK